MLSFFQHFPNLKEIDLSYSKDLVTFLDLVHAPKIEVVYLYGCVSLGQIHSSSNVPRTNMIFGIEDSGAVKINIGGSTKGTSSSSSGIVIVLNYLDLRNLSFNKVRMKVLARGEIISGVGYKHVVMPLAELRKEIQSLGSLLPFVSKLHWIESPIEIGHDFNQHFTFDQLHHQQRITFKCPTRPSYSPSVPRFTLKVKVRGDRSLEMIHDDQAAMKMKATTTFMKVEEEEEEELLMEDCCNILTRLVSNNVTRWSLLTDLMLKESDIIGNAAGWSIPQVSILTTLIAISHDDDYCRRIEPHIDAKLSLDIPTSAADGYSFPSWYTYLFSQVMFSRHVFSYDPLDYHLRVAYQLLQPPL